jgi:spoIIIJ-associated protein
MAETDDLHARVTEFLDKTLSAMGIPLQIAVDDTTDSVRFDLSGDGGEVLVQRRAEALDALQHIVNTAYRRKLEADRTFVLDYLGYRKGKDAELKQITRFTMEKAKSTGTPQEIGPLNPYARRLVHLTVAEDPQTTSESIGDAFLKTVIISVRHG